ncbi:MAG: aspartate carbamoyltransferase catalytic subunit [Deltaproteobacteria bacterium]|nr:MAG: aspartate carbamoyltransferase catalytic subunit [Deltaproteobacteria bacterium]
MARDSRHLVGLSTLSGEAIASILDDASRLRDRVRENGPSTDLAGRVVALMFMEPSTRTRSSFTTAAFKLGAQVLPFDAASSSTTKGESLLDTARTVVAAGADAIVIRHKQVGGAHFLASRLSVPVINAGDGIHEHPTQGLLDALTLRDALGTLEGKTVAIVGDIRHSRVARSNCFALPKLGARVLLAGPGTLCPPELAALGVEVRRNIDDVLDEADAIMLLRIQRERIGGALLPSIDEYRRFYGLDVERLQRRPELVVLHPAPMNRGVEVAHEVADSHQSHVFRQMENGVYVRMAVYMRALEQEVV